jgi:hypothetical protein
VAVDAAQIGFDQGLGYEVGICVRNIFVLEDGGVYFFELLGLYFFSDHGFITLEEGKS